MSHEDNIDRVLDDVFTNLVTLKQSEINVHGWLLSTVIYSSLRVDFRRLKLLNCYKLVLARCM